MNKKKKIGFLLLLAALFVTGSLFAHVEPAHAIIPTLEDAAKASVAPFLVLIASILYFILRAVTWLGSFAVDALRIVTSYNQFNIEEVQIGWRIVRDIINSFYIVVLIAIAISTIIRFQKFDFRQTLPRLLISAVLVNFSFSICLLAINFTSSVMFTFVRGIDQSWPGLLIGLRAPQITALGAGTLGPLSVEGLENAAREPLGYLNAIVAVLFGIVIMGIAIFAMLTYLLILVVRIVVLWLLIILSPLAFFLWGTPGRAQNYWGDWLGEFIKALITGPVLMFFLYLNIMFFVENAADPAPYGFNIAASQLSSQGTVTAIGSVGALFPFIVGITLMFAGLEIANSLGARGTAFAQNASKKLLSAPLKYAGRKLQEYDSKRYKDDKFSVQSVMQGLATLSGASDAKIKANIAEGQRKRQELAGKLPAGVGQYVKGLTGGSVDLTKDVNALFGEDSLLKRTGKSIVGIGDKNWKNLDALTDERSKLQSRQLSRKLLANAEPGDLVKTRADLENEIGQRNGSIQLHQNQLSEIRRLEELNDKYYNQRIPLSDQEKMEYKQLESSLDVNGAEKEDMQRLAAEAAEHEQTIEELEAKNREQNELATTLKAAGISDEQTAGQFKQEVDSAYISDDAREKELQKVIRGRRQQLQAIRSTQRHNDRKAEKEYRDVAYETNERYPEEYIFAQALSNATNKNQIEFGADLVKAADQGMFDNIVLKIMKEQMDIDNPVLDEQGMKTFVDKYMVEKVGMRKQQALDVITRVSGRNQADFHPTQSFFTKMDDSGDYRLSSKTERSEMIQKTIEKKLKAVLTKGGADGITIRDKTGKKVIHPAVRKAFKEQSGTLKQVLQDQRFYTDLEREVAVMLRQEANASGIPDSEIKGFVDSLTSTS